LGLSKNSRSSRAITLSSSGRSLDSAQAIDVRMVRSISAWSPPARSRPSGSAALPPSHAAANPTVKIAILSALIG